MTSPTLLAITPGDTRDLFPWIDALAAAGLTDIVLRERHRTAPELQRLYSYTRQRVPRVWVHLYTAQRLAEVPRRLHLPSNPSVPDGMRPERGFGTSAHTEQEVEDALRAGAAYVLFSPVYRPTSKPNDTRTPIGEDRFLRHAAGRPVWALGGLSPSRWRTLTARGATGAAVLGDLFGQPSPDAAAARLIAYGVLASSSSSEPVTNTSGS